MEEKCGQCHYFNSKDGICRNKQMQKECFQGDKDNILYVSREEQKCALFKAKVKDNRPLTPEILAAAGWTKWHENDAVVNFERKVDDVYFNLDFRKRIKKIDIQVDNCIKARLYIITVGEFNTLLDIVKLSKFQIK